MISRKGQVWIMDVTVSLILFSAAAIIAFNILLNTFSSNTSFGELKKDAIKISEYLLAEGTPADWDETTIIRPGLATLGRINESKVTLGMNMTNASYEAMKPRLQTLHDFLVVFEGSDGDLIEFGDFCTFGSPDVDVNYTLTPSLDCHYLNFTSTVYDDLVVINRFAVYDSSIVRMVVYVWG
ncbi:hypothetical protein JW826_05670 [Candidatus Woesearchaeota archaeon]|nr:hypothetical protein [Candidatus Woesearchaeota archaeon]